MKKVLFLVLGISFLFSFSESLHAQTQGGVIQQDYDALVALYNSTHGDSWTNHSGWSDPNTPVSQWYGVTVEGDRVVGIILQSNNLVGSLPPEIVDLTALKILFLNYNNLSGPPPMQLGQMPWLVELDLSGCQLIGTIPEEWSTLTNLRQFSIEMNQFSGTLPDWISTFTNLNRLMLRWNQFTGEIPSSWASLTSLHETGFSSNNLSGDLPAWISNWAQDGGTLYLPLADNNFTGNIPDSWQNLNMFEIDLSNNNITGTIPEWIGNWTGVQQINFSGNQLSGIIPAELATLPQLFYLNLQNNDFDASSCSIIQQLSQISTLTDLIHSPQNNGFDFNSDCGLDLVQGVIRQDYEALVAFYNATNGDQWVNNSGWLIEGVDVENWYGVTVENQRVVALELFENNLTGYLPISIGLLGEMRLLDLTHNHIAGDLPNAIGDFRNLNLLKLGDNQFTGQFPESVCTILSLSEIEFNDNQLTGTIPREIGQLGELRKLNLQNNQFSGTIPNEIGGLSQLTYLWLANNQLSGQIPWEIGNFGSLLELSLNNNQFDGPPPESLNYLGSLERLYLQFNNFDFSNCRIINNLNNLQNLIDYQHSPQNSGFSFDSDCNLPLQILAEYDFNGQANDLSGSGYNGSIYNAFNTQNQCGNENEALGFDGDEDYVEINPDMLKDLEQGSVEFVLKIDRLNSDHWFFCYSMDTHYGLSFAIDGNGSFCNQLNGGIRRGNPNQVNVGEWVHLAMTWDGMKIRSYVNGQLDMEWDHIGYPTQSDEPLVIGIHSGHEPYYSFPGAIDNVRIYQGVLSPEQIEANHIESLNCFGTDRDILAIIYNELDGDQWNNSDNWNSVAPLNEWFGVDFDGERVVGLNLGANNLSGKIPPAIGGLSRLRTLSLEDNRVQGPIPINIFELELLEYLNISHNELNEADCSRFFQINEQNSINEFIHSPQNNGFSFENVCSDCTIDGVTAKDYAGLEALFRSTAGENWTNNEGWMNTEIPVYQWFGIIVEGNRVVSIELSNNNLNGFIPEQIGLLDEVRYLYVDRNQLSGELPVELSRLMDLRECYLMNNNLSGEITGIFENCEELLELNFNNNNFSGNIPAKLINLPKIQWLQFGNNNFFGPIPEITNRNSHLEQLTFGHNQLSGEIPESFMYLDRIQGIQWQHNQLIGDIPEWLAGLENLVHLNISDNSLSGVVENWLFELPSLTFLDISNNLLEGIIPELSETNERLRTVRLQQNSFSGALSESLANLSNLNRLDVANNDLAGDIPRCFLDMNLNVLNISGNRYTDLSCSLIQDLISTISDFTFSPQQDGLDYFEICDLLNQQAIQLDREALVALYHSLNGDNWQNNDNWLEGDHQNWFGVGVSVDGRVNSLNLAFNNLTGTIPDEIGNLDRVTKIWMFGNNITGQLPESFSRLGALEHLWMSDNDLIGELPSGFWTLPSLSSVELSDNPNLSADIANISLFPKIIDFMMSNCNLYGSLPDDIDNLDLLMRLRVANNSINGSIPNNLVLCKLLEDIDFSNNNLSGSIPPELFELPFFGEIRAENNQLTIDINKVLTCPTLRYVNLANNEVFGEIPQFIANERIQGINLNDNHQIVGALPDNLFSCHMLWELRLSGLNLDGELNDQIGNFHNLQWLDLSENNLTGYIAESIGIARNLRQLTLCNNDFSSTGAIPNAIYTLVNLEWVDLGNIGLMGSISEDLRNLQNLKSFSLYGNFGIEGTIPESIAELQQLEYLNIDGCSISSLPNMETMSMLKSFRFSYNTLGPDDCDRVNSLRVLKNWDEFVHSPQQDGFNFDLHCGNNQFEMDYCFNINELPPGENPLFEYGWESSAPANLSIYVANYWTSFDNTRAFYLRNRDVIDGVRQTEYIKSPGIMVSGDNPVITWNEVAFSQFNTSGTKGSPRNLLISVDGINFTLVDSYTTAEMPDAFLGDCWRTQEYSLEAYIGQRISWKWELESVNNEYTYWCIDNICFEEAKTEPLLSYTGNLEFTWPVLIFYPAHRIIKVINQGRGDVNIESVDIIGDQVFHWINSTGMPVTISGVKGANEGLCNVGLEIDIQFAPLESREYHAILRITTNAGIMDLPLYGVGKTCEDAVPIIIGENWSPHQNTIFSYTPSSAEWVTVSSCHPYNTTDPYYHSFDTYLTILGGCNIDNKLFENDDLEWDACAFNRASSGGTVLVNAGQTIYILWPRYFVSPEADNGFVFTVSTESATFPVNLGDEKIVYYGYDPMACVTLTPTIEGGVAPFTYLWSTGETTESITVCPNEGLEMKSLAEYFVTITDSRGATGTAIVSVNIVDVRCGNNLDKVLVCKTTGNGKKQKKESICVSPNAVPAHLANGATLGDCGDGLPGTDGFLGEELFTVYPNPNYGEFTIQGMILNEGKTLIEIKNVLGQSMYREEIPIPQGNLVHRIKLLDAMPGLYFIIIQNGPDLYRQTIVIE